MVFGHFNRTLPILPSPQQILQGIIQAQIDQYSHLPANSQLDKIIKLDKNMWHVIFSLTEKEVDFKKPLTHKILSNPNNNFVKTLVYIYSMETFVFSEMNRASRTKDTSKIKYYGAFASALGYIIHCGNSKTIKNSIEEKVVYRGLQIEASEIKRRFTKDALVNLPGFTSTTLSQHLALKFALNPPPKDPLQPVLFKISLKGSQQYFNLASDCASSTSSNSSHNDLEYSAYPEEQEVLLQEGIRFRVVAVEQQK